MQHSEHHLCHSCTQELTTSPKSSFEISIMIQAQAGLGNSLDKYMQPGRTRKRGSTKLKITKEYIYNGTSKGSPVDSRALNQTK